MNKSIEHLLTNAETASVLSVNVKTLNQWRWQGGGPSYVKVGRLVRYRESELVSWLEKASRRSTSESVQK